MESRGRQGGLFSHGRGIVGRDALPPEGYLMALVSSKPIEMEHVGAVQTAFPGSLRRHLLPE